MYTIEECSSFGASSSCFNCVAISEEWYHDSWRSDDEQRTRATAQRKKQISLKFKVSHVPFDALFLSPQTFSTADDKNKKAKSV